jgi:hypothetical protein
VDLRGEDRPDRPIETARPAPDWHLRGACAPLNTVTPGHTMNTPRNSSRRLALRLWLAGQAIILVGAAAMAWMHSFIPMALAGSAALMMTVPLVKALATGRRVRR